MMFSSGRKIHAITVSANTASVIRSPDLKGPSPRYSFSISSRPPAISASLTVVREGRQSSIPDACVAKH
jgi:hypothetical protein